MVSYKWLVGVFQERTKNAQFIIISLRNNMFELADRLIGIYKTHNCTKSVTINPAKICSPLQAIDVNTTTTETVAADVNTTVTVNS